MSLIKVHDKYFKRYISSEELDTTVKNLAYQVASDLEDNCIPLFVGILNGSFIYASDLVARQHRLLRFRVIGHM